MPRKPELSAGLMGPRDPNADFIYTSGLLASVTLFGAVLILLWYDRLYPFTKSWKTGTKFNGADFLSGSD